MKMLLVPYDPFGDTSINQLVEDAMASHRPFYGSDLARTLGYANDLTFDEVIHTAMRVCAALHIAVRYHFLPLYRQGDNGLYADWKLSRLACTLIVMHADLSHPEVTEVQLQLLQKVM
jgi:DNA-damage-inducible protein D